MEIQQSHDDHQMIGQCPRISQDLMYVQTSDKVYTVKNIQTGRYFKLNQSVVRVMQLLDGTKSAEMVSEESGLSLQTIGYVIDQLARLDLLETEGSPSQSQAKMKRQEATRRWGHRLIFIQKTIFSSDRWMNYVYRQMGLKYLFHPYLFIVLLAIYVSAAIIVCVYYNDIGIAIHRLFSPGVFLLLSIPVYLLMAIPHELAHGFTCKHFGGRVQALGVGLYYLQPAFFCDVSDVWLFPKRYQRVLTHAAGLLVNLLLAALAILLVPFGLHLYWLMEFVAMMVLVAAILVVVNINPLIQLDGYYIVADILGIDNLRKKAFSMLFLSILFVLQKVPRAAISNRSRSPRERIILLVYALLSAGYTVVMLWYVGIDYSGQLLGHWSWIVSSLLVIILFLLPLWNWWREGLRNYKSGKD